MGVMTIRAPDSATALELVQRRLGDDALIMSTTTRDGQVEIVAATAPIEEERQDTNRETPKAQVSPMPGFLNKKGINDFASVLEKAKAAAPAGTDAAPAASAQTGKAAGRGAGVDITLDDDVAPTYSRAPEPTPQPAPVSKPVASPDPIARPQNTADPVSDASNVLLDPIAERDGILAARRVVLFGPSGAGKAMTALQLSAMQRIRQPDLKVEFVFCGNGSFADGALLAQKSHLLGMNTVFAYPAEIPAPAKGSLQIVVMSGRNGAAPDMVRALLDMPAAKGALVLPAGLRTDRLQKVADVWKGLASGVVLGTDADDPADDTDTENANNAGLAHLWTSVSDRVLEGLSIPETEEPDEGPDAPAPHVFFRHRLTSSVEEASK